MVKFAANWWKYDDEYCVCGEVESEEHVLFDCNLYMDMRKRGWKEKFASVNVDVYNAIKGYEAKIIVLKEKLYGIWVWYGRSDRQVNWKDWDDFLL